jgi:hypothetical protein
VICHAKRHLNQSFEKVQNQKLFKKPTPRKPFDNYLTPIEATPCIADSGKMDGKNAQNTRFKENKR